MNSVASPTITSMSSVPEVEGTTPRQSVQSAQMQGWPPLQPQPLQPQPLQVHQPRFYANGNRQYVPYSPARGAGAEAGAGGNVHEMPG
jgi:hypothetical protein